MYRRAMGMRKLLTLSKPSIIEQPTPQDAQPCYRTGAVQQWTEDKYTANRDTHPPFNPNVLYVGQELWIGCMIVTVTSGDTIQSIARAYNVTPEYVVESNNYGGQAVSLDPLPLTIIEWP